VFQLVQIYLATDNERPINETSMFESNQWTMSQEKTTPSMVEYVCQSDTVLANIITKLVLARQQVQAAIKVQCEPEPGPESGPVEIPVDNVKHEIKSEQLEVINVESMNDSDDEMVTLRLQRKRQQPQNEQVEMVNVQSTADSESPREERSNVKLSEEQKNRVLAICRDLPLPLEHSPRRVTWDERVRLIREQVGVTLTVDRLREILHSKAKERSAHSHTEKSHIKPSQAGAPPSEMQTNKMREICRQMNDKSWRVKAKAVTDQLGLTYNPNTLRKIIRALEASAARKSLSLRPGGIMNTN